MKTLSVLAILLSLSPAAAQEEGPPQPPRSFPAPSAWQSSRGLIEIHSSTGGTIVGTYTHQLFGFACNTPVQLVGTGNPTTLIAAATLGPCHMIIAWRGRTIGNQLTTAVTNAAVQPRGLLSTTTGNEIFHRVR